MQQLTFTEIYSSKTMKVYFCGSIRGGRDHADIYMQLIKHIQSLNCQVLTEHVGCKEKDANGVLMPDSGLSDIAIHDRDIAWLDESDVIVAEVTMPSLGVGYELGHAKLKSKPTLCLFREGDGKRLSAMVAGAEDKMMFKVVDYKEVDVAKGHIEEFIKNHSDE